jgi:hypothetical protein
VACRTAASSTPQQQSRIGAYRGPRATLIFAITRTMMRCTRSRTNDVERITSLRGALWPSSGCWKLFRLCSSAMRWANGPVVAKRAPGTGHRCRAHQRSPSINDTKIFRTVRSARALSDQPKRLISIRFGGKGKSVAQEGWPRPARNQGRTGRARASWAGRCTGAHGSTGPPRSTGTGRCRGAARLTGRNRSVYNSICRSCLPPSGL